MEQRKKHRKVLRIAFTKGAREIDALIAAPSKDVSKIQVCIQMLQQKFNDLTVVDAEIYENLLMADTSEEELLAEMESRDDYTKVFTNLRLQCEKLLEKPELAGDEVRSEVSENNSFVNMTGKRKFKLPTIQFKQFDGSIRDWLSFWAQFKKIHEDADIDLHDKIEYLIQATTPGSRARQLVESFPAMGENYEKIIEGLQSRFGREDLQIEVYVRELLKLVLSNAMSKDKIELSTLYDKIETQLRALETLGITSDKCSAMIYPLIESCLPADLLRVWQRSALNTEIMTSDESKDGKTESTLEYRLKGLMRFLKNEVENEQRITLAAEGFGLHSTSNLISSHNTVKGKRQKITASGVVTASDLMNCEIAKCIFCDGSHDSEACFKAQNFTFEQKKKMLINKRACFRCLRVGHQSSKCRIRLKCLVCNKSHVVMMCPELPAHKAEFKEQKGSEVTSAADKVLANHTSSHVFLQTLRVTLKGNISTREVRALVDTGSQRSYILKSTILALGLKPKHAEKVTHCLFGGNESTNHHYCYDVTVIKGSYFHTFEVLDQPHICNDVSPVFYGPWMQELHRLGVEVSDSKDDGPIELLLGADIVGTLYTGRRHMLECGLVAIETHIGWTVMGKVVESKSRMKNSMTVLSLFVNPSITELWKLDVLGIEDPIEKKSKEEMALETKELFLQTVIINKEGRYEVRLPWLDGHPPLPTNYSIARRRLAAVKNKLDRDNMTRRYDEAFKEWESLSIIERIEDNEKQGHFLPHRPVFKENSTTAVRPVFDASCHDKGTPSLNQCLDKGPNLIELIPSLLLRFREFKLGAVSDIKKVFLQISIDENDRDVLRFLWIEEWGTFVWNRVKEIRRFTSVEQWRHIPGKNNPADLPSCGCMLKQLMELKWWEGPDCLYEDWPSNHQKFDEEEVTTEQKKSSVTVLVNNDYLDFWHVSYFSKFATTVRVMEWIFLVSRRGRLKTVYTDNGTSFVGAESAIAKLDWDIITRETSIQRISWRFNPPTAAWWSGFWERLIGILKRLLRKVLGRALLDYEHLQTVLCECEAVINARPLTYLSGDPKDLVALTPSMFLRDQIECGLPDIDTIDSMSLCRKVRKIQLLREDLRSRFRTEYLGQLKLVSDKKVQRQIKVGELVIVGDDKSKRLDWPMGRVVEVLPGKDNQIRLVRIKTAKGQLLRPLQRLYPLECCSIPEFEFSEESKPETHEMEKVYADSREGVSSDPESICQSNKSDCVEKTTRSGRVSRMPRRFM